MTTPAVTTDVATRNVYQVNEYGGSTSVMFTHGQTRQLRPASGTSPLRKDMSRAPRAWSHVWAQYVAPPARTKFRIPGWGVAEGVIPPFSLTYGTLLDAWGADWCGSPGATGFPSTPRSQARTRLLNKLADGKANWGQTLGEARKTVEGIADASNMMLGAVNKLAKYYRMEKKAVADALMGRRVVSPNYSGDLARAVKEIPSAWLSLQFGLKPLLRDIDDSAKALDYLLQEKTPATMTLRAGGTDVRRVDATTQGLYSTRLRWALDIEARAHLSCTYLVPVSYTRSLQQVGLGNPYSVAYELMPWSWALDYVTDTGSWLNSLFARDGTSFVEGSESLLMRVVNDVVFYKPEMAYGVTLETWAHRGYLPFRAGRFSREVLTDTPLPWFPTFRNRLGLTQMANLTSALSQLCRK